MNALSPFYHPSLNYLSVSCFFLPGVFPSPELSFHLDLLLLKTSFPLYSLYIGMPCLSLNSFFTFKVMKQLQNGGSGTAERGDPTCLFLNTSFLDKCLECHLHILYFCFFLSHSFLNLCQCDPHTYDFSTQQVFNAPRKAKSEEHAQSLSLLELLQYLQLPLS